MDLQARASDRAHDLEPKATNTALHALNTIHRALVNQKTLECDLRNSNSYCAQKS